jgi:hypothetical protein
MEELWREIQKLQRFHVPNLLKTLEIPGQVHYSCCQVVCQQQSAVFI